MTMLTNRLSPKTQPVQALHNEYDAAGHVERCAPMLAYTPLQTARNSGTYRVSAWYTEDCIFSRNKTDAYALRHSREHIEETAHMVVLRRMFTGSLWGRIENSSTFFGPGSINVQDQELIYEGIQEPATFHNVFIVKSAIDYDPSTDLRPGQVNLNSVAGKCLLSVWDDLFEQLEMNDTYIDAELLDRYLACVKIALGAPAEREDIRMHARRALFTVICRYIEKNLGNFELSVSWLLREFGVSRATLFRMFENAGGVRNYIRQRRATRALLEVSRQPYQRGKISAAAEQWGFSSAPNFNRTIRDLYGMSPGSMFERSLMQLSRPLSTNFDTFIDETRVTRGASF